MDKHKIRILTVFAGCLVVAILVGSYIGQLRAEVHRLTWLHSPAKMSSVVVESEEDRFACLFQKYPELRQEGVHVVVANPYSFDIYVEGVMAASISVHRQSPYDWAIYVGNPYVRDFTAWNSLNIDVVPENDVSILQIRE